MVKTIKVRVKPVVPIPHTVTKGGVNYLFAPDCDVPEKIGNSLIETYPKMFMLAAGTVDKNEYVFKEAFKNSSIQDIFSKLNEDDQVVLYKVATDLLKKEQDAAAKVAQENEKQLLEDAKKKQQSDLETRRRKDAEASAAVAAAKK